MKYGLGDYETIIFDCDGVLLNSNSLKTNAFYETAIRFGPEAAEMLREYHLNNGGISRFHKFAWLLEKLEYREKNIHCVLQELLVFYSKIVFDGLLNCEIVSGLHNLRKLTPKSSWMVVSGSDQEELRGVLSHRGVLQLFDAGVFGSPANKNNIVFRERQLLNISPRAIFFGDSRYDHEVACAFQIDFVFIYGWTEMVNWSEYARENNIPCEVSVKKIFQ